MRAQFRTLCGCKQEITVSDPPRDYHTLTLYAPVSTKINADPNPVSLSRTFKLVDVQHSNFDEMAYYVEVLE